MSRLLLLIFVVLHTSVLAQNFDWQPVPYQQTNYYQIEGTHRFMPMQNDYWMPGGVGDFFGIHEQFIVDEFDSCSMAVWNAPYYWGLPDADFRMFVDIFGTIRIMGAGQEFYIPLKISEDEIDYFSLNLLIRLDSNVGSANDSVKYFTILENDSITSVGHIHISKLVGLLSFTSFKDLELDTTGSFRTFNFIGLTDSNGSSVGVTIPAKEEFLPYSSNEELLFEYKYWVMNQDTSYQTKEFHHVFLDSFYNSNGESELIGHAIKYDQQGFYKATTPDYRIKLEPMLESMTSKKVSVPFWSDSDYDVIFSHNNFEVLNDSGIVGKISGQATGFCDTNMAVDGHGQTEIYSSVYGLLYKEYHPFGPPQSWRLIAKKSDLADYGDWPTNLGLSAIGSNEKVRVYPNPNNGIMYWKFEGKVDAIVVFDQSGRLITRIDNPSNQVDISGIDAGLYFLQFQLEDGVENQSVIIE